MRQSILQQAQNQQSIFNRAQQMANGKTASELEQTARNICAEKGIDYDDALQQFRKAWGSIPQ